MEALATDAVLPRDGAVADVKGLSSTQEAPVTPTARLPTKGGRANNVDEPSQSQPVAGQSAREIPRDE